MGYLIQWPIGGQTAEMIIISTEVPTKDWATGKSKLIEIKHSTHGFLIPNCNLEDVQISSCTVVVE